MSRFSAYYADVISGLKLNRVWIAFAWDEIKLRYNRSVLGVLWIVASYAFFVAGISIFFAGFSDASGGEFVIYVALGYAAFMFLMGNVIDGAAVFTTSSSWIKSTDLPYSIYVFKSIFRSVVPFLMQLSVAFALIGFYGGFANMGWASALALPALFLFMLCAVPLQYTLGLVAARWPDISHMISAITRLWIFVTPILWVREEVDGLRAVVADLNPLTHFLEIFRNPLMGAEARPLSWAVVILATAVMWGVAGIAAKVMRRRLPFWI